MATKKKPGTAMVRWDEELAKAAQEQASSERAAGNFFSVRGGQLSYQGKPIKGGSMTVVVVDYVLENHWFSESEFDPDNPQSPTCFAFGRKDEDMAPHAEVTAAQSESCAKCPKNVFGSADKGRGKACKNIRRLALIPSDALDGGIEDAEIGFLRLPVTSCKGWGEYVTKLRDVVKRPTWAVVTRIDVQPHKQNQVEVTFTLEEKVGNEHLQALKEKCEATAKIIELPYAKNVAREKPAARGRSVPKGGVKKTGTRKAKF